MSEDFESRRYEPIALSDKSTIVAGWEHFFAGRIAGNSAKPPAAPDKLATFCAPYFGLE